MDDKIKCLYYIKDSRTDKIIYIGQTENYKQRKYCHFGHKKKPVDKYMYEEGRENFIMEKFDIDCANMSNDERKRKEDELILQYDTINNGMNKIRSGLISKNDNYESFKHKRTYRNNIEHYREYHKQYKNTEKYKEYQKDYYQKHREEIIERCKMYQQNNENYKEYQKQYQHEHKEKYKEYQRQCRLKKKQEKTALSEG